jgi:putative SOS response-associated peptidase YedK
MCGRFVSREQAAIEREYNIRVRAPFERVYNAAPSMELPVIRQLPGGNEPGAGAGADVDAGGAREAVAMRWGLVPSWWSQPTPPTSTINARSEEAAGKPMWRHAVRHTRALVPALGWYEWRAEAGAKQPYFIHAAGMAGICFAGLWSTHRDNTGQEQLSFAILTRAASAPLTAVHNRMPVVLAPALFDEWLAPWAGEHGAQLASFVARSQEEFEYYPVSRFVNAPRNQGERCIERVGA